MSARASDWRTYRLAEVCTKIGSGATPRGGGSVYVPYGVAFIRSQNVLNSGLNSEGLTYLTDEHASELRNVEVARGDVLINITGDSVARVCQAPQHVLPARVNQHVAIVRTNPVQLDQTFLRYFLIQPQVQEELLGLASAGATRNALTKAMLERLEIAAPLDVQQQQAISRTLSVLDDKIELNRRMSQTLEAIAQAIFKSWFVDFEPVHAKAEGEPAADVRARLGLDDAKLALFPSTFTETRPAGWKPTTLKNLTTKIGSGATPRGGQEVYVDEGVALIRSQNVYDAQFAWDGLARIDAAAARQLANVEVRVGDVLFNITGASILRTCIVPRDVLPARVNQHVAVIRAKPGVPPCYLHLHLLQADTKAYLLGLNAGASREAVTKSHIESVPLLDPGAALLAAFESVVAPLYAQAQVCASQVRMLSALRDTLLPKLLSGELPVPAAA